MQQGVVWFLIRPAAARQGRAFDWPDSIRNPTYYAVKKIRRSPTAFFIPFLPFQPVAFPDWRQPWSACQAWSQASAGHRA
jgi:hypothetical protein